MDNQLVICPICSQYVRSNVINKHLDEGCSEGTIITDGNGSNETFQLDSTATGSTSRKSYKPKTIALAPIFASSVKGKGVSTQPLPISRSQRIDQLHTTASQSKRPSEKDSPTSHTKRQKTTKSSPTIPFAERFRPKKLSELVGQKHLTESGSLLATMLQTNANWSIILWGPPGCGKTSLARLLVECSDAFFKEMSGTASGVTEVKSAVEEAKKMLSLCGRRTVLFLDEIHRFNKAQQDVLLPPIDRGHIQLVGATTENPSFRLTGALLSRCRVLRMEPLSDRDISELLARAIQRVSDEEGRQDGELNPKETNDVDSVSEYQQQINSRIISGIVSIAGGDARKALSLLEVAIRSPKETPEKEIMNALKQSLVVSYDRTGEDHYDMISALHKSVRGSHGDGAMYWLARMLTAGEDPIFIARRMVVCASEDIGLADNHALPLAMAVLQACQVIGMPECRLNLAHLVAYLSEAPKSTRAYEAYNRAEEAAKKTSLAPVPMQIRNAPTMLMEGMGYGKDYHYNPDYRHPVHNEYLPPELANSTFLSKAGDVSGKTWDEQALCEWERELNGGERWEGRDA